jgi:hypothetical protein
MTIKNTPIERPQHGLQLKGSTPISEPSFVDVWNLLDILQYCGDRGNPLIVFMVRPS